MPRKLPVWIRLGPHLLRLLAYSENLTTFIDAPLSRRLLSSAISNTMLPVIENLLILQDRDRKIMRIEAELANISPERVGLEKRAEAARAQAEAGKTKAK